MTDNLFNTQQDPPALDPNKNYLEELVGDSKKFKDAEALARGKYESDSYIKILERRSDELRQAYQQVREENMAKAKLEEMIDQIAKSQRTPSNDLPPETGVNQQPPIDPTEIENRIISRLQQNEVDKKYTNNFNTVRDKLTEQFGTNYQNVLNKQMETIGLTADDVNDLARKSPTAFFKMLGLDEQPRQQDIFQSPPRSSRTDNFAPRGAQKRTWSYYQELKKTNPDLYLDPKISVQMQKDAIELGEAFKDGDFSRYGD